MRAPSCSPGGDAPLGDSGGYFVEPTLFTATLDDLGSCARRSSGPVLVALPYDTLEEVAQRANDTDYGLAAGVWTRDSRAHRLAALLQAPGSVYVNTWGELDPWRRSAASRHPASGASTATTGSTRYLETKTVWTKVG